MFAEWNETKFILVSLPHKYSDWNKYLEDITLSYYNFVKTLAEYVKVVLIHHSSTDISEFKKIKNCEFFCFDTNDTWIRDYGAISTKNAYLDFKFNAWGDKFKSELDNSFNKEFFSKYFKKDLKSVDFILEGGSIDTNEEYLLTTSKCLLNDNRNKKSRYEIEQVLKQNLNIKEVIWLEHGEIKGDDTDCHIDTLARFINKDTIVYSACEDENDINYLELKKMEEELKKLPFKLIALNIPKAKYYEGRRLGCTYVNFVYANDAIIMPSYDDENDEINLNKLQLALPDKKIIALNSLNFVRENGSLHCSCMNIF
ncbi:agmatine deiminase family protein [Campylobacter canadensis]|uniref:Agmatine deiminase family protein n=1 Tax=Campylobacter canadensis TaxID=449520 RepID=A0ABS7WUN2_9BACT|nr:agmatine deiminase family protein [Campylobacter canadensis]MBZ7988042.1 agmatine deiminase family protein [Campylobacter canadensis]MBZ7995475.1 agmatine deiminase family protein [Campylobacter canadensis]MBZ7997281.1 agmatine deiminase family protein [Campylobacter canadensis]MBZ7999002.1 agmatine deiminase family protein [Campylobacter canadensis]MBZ8000809.1 agmatine deiminase family protein [Campylobacter canadensis]